MPSREVRDLVLVDGDAHVVTLQGGLGERDKRLRGANSPALTVTHCGSPVRSFDVNVADRADLAAVGVHEVSTLNTVNVIVAHHR